MTDDRFELLNAYRRRSNRLLLAVLFFACLCAALFAVAFAHPAAGIIGFLLALQTLYLLLA